MRILLNGGRVQMNGDGKCFPHYGSVVSSAKPKELSNMEDVETKKEVVGGALDVELTRRLNALNFKKPINDLKSRLLNVDPKKKLINFTI